MYSPEQTAASLALQNSRSRSPVGVQHIPAGVRISCLLPTCQEKLLEELSAKSIFLNGN